MNTILGWCALVAIIALGYMGITNHSREKCKRLCEDQVLEWTLVTCKCNDKCIIKQNWD